MNTINIYLNYFKDDFQKEIIKKLGIEKPDNPADICVAKINIGNNDTKDLIARIIDCFENILDSNNITIPDKNREGNKEEARIYGETYYNLENKIKNILMKGGVIYESNVYRS
jgi:hypothetical protein